jgi:hypothetical protein
VIYVCDTNSLSNILNHYYPDRFPTFLEKFDELVGDKRLISVREARFELKGKFDDDNIIDRLKVHNHNFFEEPTVEELAFITQVYSVPHFRQNLNRKKLLQGGYFADPFIIAKAKIKEAIVITEEDRPENGVRIPNICDHFGIECVKIEGFLIKEDWKF